ncbi:CxC ATPase DNA modification system associated small protein [Streptomyces sp. NRRL F-2580]|uniref:CxC ATPase DNA modification system associated small protein n=1 Tax=Streptomyces sp. NRRL F-2580 TaxID=1463841 RepID=UPI00055BF4BB|nr:CxC ATPase DNA modification system associated small protein [Streptomyces sp. NRRL F-2580]
MSLDSKVTEGIRDAVAEAGQDPKLAQRLVAWMTAVTSGNEDVNDSDAAERRLDVLYESTTTSRRDAEELF